MRESQIVSWLNYPDADYVRYNVSRANLNAKERRVIDLRIHDGLTVEQAAEQLDVSPRTVQYQYRQAIDKLDSCWSCLPWLGGQLKQ